MHFVNITMRALFDIVHISHTVIGRFTSNEHIQYFLALSPVLISRIAGSISGSESKSRINLVCIKSIFMKLFKTSNIRIVQLCQELFHFELPSIFR